MDEKKTKIGVMGSASGPTTKDPKALEKAFGLGQAIARRDCILINGACPGLPDKAAEGARSAGGFVFGVSPAFSEREHLEVYGSPVEHYDIIMYSGMGFMERDVVNIRSSDAIVVVGGGIGTLNEFTVAYEEQKPIGILTTTGGISDHIPEIMKFCNRTSGPDRIIYDDDPVRLVDRLLQMEAEHKDPMRMSDIGGEKDEGATKAKRAAALHDQQTAHEKSRRKKADEEYS